MQNLSFDRWIISQLLPYAPGFWLVLSSVAAILLWAWRRQLPPRWYHLLWTGQSLLIPYFGLLVGALSPRLMGLQGIDWQTSLSLGLGLVFVQVILIFLVRATIDWADPDFLNTPEQKDQDGVLAGAATSAILPHWRIVLGIILFSGAEEFHWGFLRGAVWEILLALPVPPDIPVYWAVWIAAAIAFCEGLLIQYSFTQHLLRTAVLIATSILFFYTRNFWLCWALHATALLILAPSYSTPPRQTKDKTRPNQSPDVLDE